MTTPMIVGTVIAVPIVLIVLVLLLPLRLTVRLKKVFNCDAVLSAVAKIGFVSFVLYPKKPKKIRLSDFSRRKFEKMRKNEKMKPKKKKSTSLSRNFSFDMPDDIGDTLDLISSFIDALTGNLHSTVDSLKIGIATQSAASTAISYGAIGAVAEGFMEMLSQNTVLSANDDNIAVFCDYTASGIYADIDLTLSVITANVIRSMPALLPLLESLTHEKRKNKTPDRAERSIS